MPDNRVSMALPPQGRWLEMAHDGVLKYGAKMGLSDKLTAMCAHAASEACEELVGRAQEAGVDAPFTLALDSRGETIVIDILYNAKIPLNPHKAEDYEVPDAASDLESVDMDTLWLHMIKRDMDRVVFRVDGNRHTLRMVKYRRDEGKERQAWIMGVKPELRADLDLHLEDPDAQHSSSLLQAKGGGVLRLGPSETFFIMRMNGSRTFHDMYMEHIDALGLVSPKALVTLYEHLEQKQMLAQRGDMRHSTWFRRAAKTMFAPNISIPAADAVVTRAYGLMRGLFSWWGLALLVGSGLSGLAPLILHHEHFATTLGGMEQAVLADPWMLLPVYVLMLVHVALHELGHGMTCKHFGGRVPRLGIMFYLATFIFYCDVTAAWNFPRKRDRILVSLAGPLVSFALLGPMLWAAGSQAVRGTPWETMLLGLCLASAFSLAMNFNPFIKMDAYYMLMDATGIVNLRERSFAFLRQRLLAPLGLATDESVPVTLRERRVFWWYGVLGAVVTAAFMLMPLVRMSVLLHAQSPSGGKVLLAAVTGTLFVTRMASIAFAKVKAARHKEFRLQ